MDEAVAALAAVTELTGWHLVTLHEVHRRLAREGGGAEPRAWMGVIEFRARTLVLDTV